MKTNLQRAMDHMNEAKNAAIISADYDLAAELNKLLSAYAPKCKHCGQKYPPSPWKAETP